MLTKTTIVTWIFAWTASMLSTSLFAKDFEAKTTYKGMRVCEEKIKTMVTGLELMLIQVEGPVEGDYAVLPITLTLEGFDNKGVSAEIIHYSVVVEHTNSDNEHWTNPYRFEMLGEGNQCWIRTYEFMGSR